MVFVPAEDGRWVDENYARLAEVINDYDPHLQLRWIPPDRRTREDKKPYVVVDTRIEQPVVYASELDTPEQILTDLFMADNVKNGWVIDRIEAAEAAQKALEMKQWIEKMEEGNDYAKFLMQSPLNTVRHNGKKFDENRRVIGTIKGRRTIT